MPGGISLVVPRHLLGKKRNEIKLLSKNLKKKRELEHAKFRVVEMIPLVVDINLSNIGYLKAKITHGHLISTEDLR